MFRSIIFALLLLFFSTALGTTLYVPDDHATIQGAIDAASSGDTIVDGNQAGSVVVFQSAEGGGSAIDGFSLVNGRGTLNPFNFQSGGAIYCYQSSPRIANNVIAHNSVAADDGGGFYCYFACFPQIVNSIFWANSAQRGAELYVGDTALPSTVGTIPGSGIRTFSATLPVAWSSGDSHPFQALVGPWSGPYTALTNLMVLAVE